MDKKIELSVVIPAYREGGSLSHALNEIIKAVENVTSNYEVIVVDDGSPDDTWSVINRESANYPFMSAVRFSRNFGKESAIYAGLEMSKGSAVVVIDGDLQHPPELIGEMFASWKDRRADIVEGLKKERGSESVFKRLCANIFYRIFSRTTGHNLDNATDFKLMDRRVVDALLRMGEVNRFFRGMTAWLGFRTMQIEFEVPDGCRSSSRWTSFGLLKLSMTALTSFSTLPLHLVTFFGFIFLAISILLGFHTIYVKLSGSAVTGFATVILLLLIMGSFLMISLGIIGEYLARIYKEVKGRPHYVPIEKICSKKENLDL